MSKSGGASRVATKSSAGAAGSGSTKASRAAKTTTISPEREEELRSTENRTRSNHASYLYREMSGTPGLKASLRANTQPRTAEDARRATQAAAVEHHGKISGALRTELEDEQARQVGYARANHETLNKEYKGIDSVQAAHVIQAEAARINREGLGMKYPDMLTREANAYRPDIKTALRADHARYERGDTAMPEPSPAKAKESARQELDRLQRDSERMRAYMEAGPGKSLDRATPEGHAAYQRDSKLGEERYFAGQRLREGERTKEQASRAKVAAKEQRVAATKARQEQTKVQTALAKMKGDPAYDALSAGRAVAVRASNGGNLHIMVPQGKIDAQGRIEVAAYHGGESKPYSTTTRPIADILRTVHTGTERVTPLAATWKPPSAASARNKAYSQLVQRYTHAAEAVSRARIVRHASDARASAVDRAARRRMATLEDVILAGPQSKTRKKAG